MRAFAVTVAVVMLLVVTSWARADDQQAAAKQKFSEATAAHQRGEYLQAAAMFEEAHRLAPAAGAKFNAGIAWDQGGDLPRAADAYETALDIGGLTEDEANQAEARLSALKKVLGYLRIDQPVGAAVSVAHVERAPVPLRVHVRPGSYEVRAERSGHTRTVSVELGADETKSVTIDDPLPAKSPAASSTGYQPLPSSPALPRDDRSDGTSQRTWGWVSIGAGAALAGAAVFLGMRTLEARDDWEKSGRQKLDEREKAVSYRLWTNVAWGGAAVGAGVGTVLLLTAPRVEF